MTFREALWGLRRRLGNLDGAKAHFTWDLSAPWDGGLGASPISAWCVVVERGGDVLARGEGTTGITALARLIETLPPEGPVEAICGVVASGYVGGAKVNEEIRLYVDGVCVKTIVEVDPLKWGLFVEGAIYAI